MNTFVTITLIVFKSIVSLPCAITREYRRISNPFFLNLNMAACKNI